LAEWLTISLFFFLVLVVWAGQRKVLWHNMREEPVLYINGKPYVVREANKPFANLEYTGWQQSQAGEGKRVANHNARMSVSLPTRAISGVREFLEAMRKLWHLISVKVAYMGIFPAGLPISINIGVSAICPS
jgi:hypothetical protein